MRSTLRINYADPAGVGNISVGTEARTARNSFDVKRPVIIVDAMALSNPAGNDDHLFSIRRLGGQVTDLFTWTQVLPANANTVKPFLPKGIGVGNIQFIIEEIATAAAGVNCAYTFDKPLIG
jgi:hypothetical protein